MLFVWRAESGKSRIALNFQAKTLFANRKNEIAIAHVSLTTSKREDQIQFLGLCVSIVRKFDESVGKRSKRMWRNSSEYKQILTKLKIPIVYKRLWKSYLDIADDITKVKQHKITIEDIAFFVKKRARACNHPIFGKILREMKSENSVGKNTKSTWGSAFATKGNDDNSPRTAVKCPSCGSGHWLSRCDNFKKRSIGERFKLVCSLKSCDNCLVPGHVARSCQKSSFCKIDGCKNKHSTFLHRKPVNTDEDQTAKNSKNENANPRQSQVDENTVHNSYVNTDDKHCESRVIGLPIVPVKVRAKQGSR